MKKKKCKNPSDLTKRNNDARKKEIGILKDVVDFLLDQAWTTNLLDQKLYLAIKRDLRKIK